VRFFLPDARQIPLSVAPMSPLSFLPLLPFAHRFYNGSSGCCCRLVLFDAFIVPFRLVFFYLDPFRRWPSPLLLRLNGRRVSSPAIEIPFFCFSPFGVAFPLSFFSVFPFRAFQYGIYSDLRVFVFFFCPPLNPLFFFSRPWPLFFTQAKR